MERLYLYLYNHPAANTWIDKGFLNKESKSLEQREMQIQKEGPALSEVGGHIAQRVEQVSMQFQIQRFTERDIGHSR